MEDFYYAPIYDAVRFPPPSPLPATENVAITNWRLKAKILRLTSKHMIGVLMDTVENDAV